MFDNQYKQFQQKGNVLLLALLVMAGLITAGVGIGAIILNEIRQARNVDFSIIAFYAAESSTENALYKLRKEEAVLSCAIGDCQANGYCPGGEEACLYPNGILTNASSWKREVSNKELTIYGKLEKNKTMQIDLYDPDQPSWAAGVGSVKISWQDSCGGSSWIELAYVSWKPGAGINWEDQRYQFRRSASQGPMVLNEFVPQNAYRVRIKAFGCDINNLVFTAWSEDNASGTQKEIPSRITIKSTGAFGFSTQAIKTIMPRKSIMSGLYDYVLFSECSLVKGEEPTCP